ncbi:uncharacterized protein FIBRA_00176 [Fibroporia radiculosa]|uniref:Uncharacterized protein n=1 Tax=Fibroporia radiculosa TaxID=599839 RepID=J7RGJ3_9APHY|nr:uncharacterized protein FIBRA_00176 [Fibroporia radiculosa]CCL98182.1 predicted protein [Fibroporia radiculosa]
MSAPPDLSPRLCGNLRMSSARPALANGRSLLAFAGSVASDAGPGSAECFQIKTQRSGGARAEQACPGHDTAKAMVQARAPERRGADAAREPGICFPEPDAGESSKTEEEEEEEERWAARSKRDGRRWLIAGAPSASAVESRSGSRRPLSAISTSVLMRHASLLLLLLLLCLVLASSRAAAIPMPLLQLVRCSPLPDHAQVSLPIVQPSPFSTSSFLPALSTTPGRSPALVVLPPRLAAPVRPRFFASMAPPFAPPARQAPPHAHAHLPPHLAHLSRLRRRRRLEQ